MYRNQCAGGTWCIKMASNVMLMDRIMNTVRIETAPCVRSVRGVDQLAKSPSHKVTISISYPSYPGLGVGGLVTSISLHSCCGCSMAIILLMAICRRCVFSTLEHHKSVVASYHTMLSRKVMQMQGRKDRNAEQGDKS